MRFFLFLANMAGGVTAHYAIAVTAQKGGVNILLSWKKKSITQIKCVKCVWFCKCSGTVAAAKKTFFFSNIRLNVSV